MASPSPRDAPGTPAFHQQQQHPGPLEAEPPDAPPPLRRVCSEERDTGILWGSDARVARMWRTLMGQHPPCDAHWARIHPDRVGEDLMKELWAALQTPPTALPATDTTAPPPSEATTEAEAGRRAGEQEMQGPLEMG